MMILTVAVESAPVISARGASKEGCRLSLYSEILHGIGKILNAADPCGVGAAANILDGSHVEI